MPHQVFTSVAVGMAVIFLSLVYIVMLVTRLGREALSDGCMEGFLDANLGGFLGGG